MSVSLRRVSLLLSVILFVFNACQCQALPVVKSATTSESEAAHVKGIADGAGIWVNMWNYPSEPDSYCLKLYASGIRNIFIQTSRSNTEAICNPQGLSKLLNAAHRYQMRVIAWSFDELNNPAADADKVILAANFRSDQGDKVDAVAANMEKDLNPEKIKQFCARVKEALGSSYPLIAVVYSPLNHAAVVASTPWPVLADCFSVLAVMSYWHSRYTKSEAYAYTLSTIKQLRVMTGKPDIEIHVIGDGMGTDNQSVSQFLLACKAGAATSASLYPNQRITSDQLNALSRYPEFFPANGRLRLAAYRELVKSGKLVIAAGQDPASSIKRGQFYQLLVRQFYPSALCASQSGEEMPMAEAPVPSQSTSEEDIYWLPGLSESDFKATDILSNAGILTAIPQDQTEKSQFLAAAISSKEAIEAMAKLVDSKGHANRLSDTRKAQFSNQRRQPNHLFVQPAYAAESKSYSLEPLSYFDAAQMVVLASGGIK